MLKLQVKEPGEYLMIGDDVKIVFTGWSKNYLRIMVDAPKEVSVIRSKAAEKAGEVEPKRYLGDRELVLKQKAEERAAREILVRRP
ncbi:MAG: carbon storage regulator [Lachnospiraceae bacterium]|nr:carbon storage regulator [Lachnospiraceae bacterium]